jgi:hypothetical protein
MFVLPNLFFVCNSFTIVGKMSVIGGITYHHLASTPSGWDNNPQGWDNDDYLNSLGGGGMGNSINEDGGYAEERFVPENDLTDEEITQMAMRSAQFYNTDTPFEQVYGIPRDGPPPGKQDEGEFQ